ncbi:ABC transporter ATP-binding protein [Lacimicrobium sp. SS2-24]|uniref:ABC transporter ATP-binding protein n=1 Tax=Lacimicrobium sp. SS2-24 TaxID=2005569 RepID=UPI000B4AAB31|nr:ABC transporter ATP-binding protein [Lacimicrobium sp. SS2-24]
MLALQQISIAYQRQQVVKNFNLNLEAGEIGCLLGPSGCGKTSVLRAIAGFEPVQQGAISLHERQVSGAGRHLAPENRRVGMVFQDFALFPHLTVAENIGFGLSKWSSSERQSRIAELLELVELTEYAQRYSHALSGGQQQRVALARAMAPRPDILLLDEPFSSLDSELRESLAGQVRAILKHERITALMVTHDRIEAFAMADKLGVMSSGRMLQWGTPDQLYHFPDNKLVADFIGKCSFLSASVTGPESIQCALGSVSGGDALKAREGEKIELMIRPHQVRFNPDSPYRARVCDRVFRGADLLYLLELENQEQLFCAAPVQSHYALDKWIGVELNLAKPVWFPADADHELT